MQKIQFYLVPNRITVTTDVTGFTTEYRQVYQRKIKLYKGIDNTLELEVKNSEQRRESVAGQQVMLTFFDSERKKVLELTGDPIPSKTGLMSVVIPRADLDDITPQMLTMTAHLLESTAEKILYADSQFGVLANVELLDGYNAADPWSETLSVFNYEFDANSYFSEIGRFGPETNNDVGLPKTVSVAVYPNSGFDGDIVVYATSDKSTSFGTVWKQLGTMTVNANTHVPENNLFSFSGDYRLIRFKFNKYNPPSSALTPNPVLTGTLDKIILRD